MVAHMGPKAIITNAVFNAFLKCKMKAHLLLDGAEGTDAEGLRLAEMAYLSEGQIPEEVGHGAVL